MNNVKILNKINEFLESENISIILDLKEKLIEDIRKESAYKTNSKSRVNAIAKIQKENTKRAVQFYNGYSLYDDKYLFTNTFYAVILNDNLGYENNNKILGKVIPTDLSYYNNVEIDFNELMLKYKTKEDYIINGIYFDSNYLKQVVDIMGTDSNFMIRDYVLYVENKDNEKAILMGKRKF